MEAHGKFSTDHRVIDLYHEDPLNRIWLSDQQRFLKRRPRRWQRFWRWLRVHSPYLSLPDAGSIRRNGNEKITKLK